MALNEFHRVRVLPHEQDILRKAEMICGHLSPEDTDADEAHKSLRSLLYTLGTPNPDNRGNPMERTP